LKKVVIIVIIFLLAISFIQKLQNKTETDEWTPPLPETYPMINRLSEISEKKSDNSIVSSLRDVEKMARITGKYHHDELLNELQTAVKQYPEIQAVQQAAVLLFSHDMLQVDMLETLIVNHEEDSKRKNGKIPKHLKKLWHDHIEDKKKLLENMQGYSAYLGEQAYIKCSAMQCEPPYLRLTQLWQMAYLLSKTDKSDEAIDYLQVGLEHIDSLEEENSRDQMYHEFHTLLGLVYLQQERYDDAVSELKASEPKNPTFENILNGWNDDLAYPLFEKGYQGAALSYWKDALAFWNKQVETSTNEDEKSLYLHSARFAR
jgi:tetratricopeptide (TPR) repeat protein